MGSAVDGVFGGDVVDHGAGVLRGLHGLQTLVFSGRQPSKHTQRSYWPNYARKRVILSPTSGKFHSGYGTTSRSDTAMYQHSHCLHAAILHVSQFHAFSSQFHSLRGPLSSCQSGRTASEVGTCDQNRPYVFASRPASIGRAI